MHRVSQSHLLHLAKKKKKKTEASKVAGHATFLSSLQGSVTQAHLDHKSKPKHCCLLTGKTSQTKQQETQKSVESCLLKHQLPVPKSRSGPDQVPRSEPDGFRFGPGSFLSGRSGDIAMSHERPFDQVYGVYACPSF